MTAYFTKIVSVSLASFGTTLARHHCLGTPTAAALHAARPTGQSKRGVRVVGTTLIVFDVADV